jgi:hypothetical protein
VEPGKAHHIWLSHTAHSFHHLFAHANQQNQPELAKRIQFADKHKQTIELKDEGRSWADHEILIFFSQKPFAHTQNALVLHILNSKVNKTCELEFLLFQTEP